MKSSSGEPFTFWETGRLSTSGLTDGVVTRRESPSGQGLTPSYLALRERISTFKLKHRSDRVQWRWSSDGRFTVKSVYSLLNDGGLRDARSSKIWGLRVPLKVKVFTWIVLKKRPLTADNLLKRGWSGNTVCMLCGSEEETVDHLFVQC
ncbi:putative ribonuclease H protein, partial [Ananas comosus]